jgi:hypothetical protein
VSKQYKDKAKYWTDARIATLKRLHAKNLTTNEIAAHMCVSKNVISGKVDALRLVNSRSKGPNHLRGVHPKKPHENTKKIYQVPSLVKLPPSRVLPQWMGE